MVHRLIGSAAAAGTEISLELVLIGEGGVANKRPRGQCETQKYPGYLSEIW